MHVSSWQQQKRVEMPGSTAPAVAPAAPCLNLHWMGIGSFRTHYGTIRWPRASGDPAG